MASPPDEIYHYSLIQEYAETTLIPDNSENTHRFGPINDQPYLYYLILGKVMYLNILGIEDYIFLRLVNILFSLGTIYFAYKIASLFTQNKLIKITYLLVFTNTLMFTFLSSAVNYDNLLNLFSTGAIFYSLRYIKQKNFRYLLMFFLFSCLALLTKVTYIPLGVILTLIISFDFFSQKSSFKNFFGKTNFRNFISIFLIILSVTAGILTLELYGLNFINYGNYAPSCAQVLTHEQCLNNSIYKRNIEFLQTLTAPEDPIHPIDYLYHWSNLMEQRIFGILAHQNLSRPTSSLIFYKFFFLLSGLLLIRNFTHKEKHAKLLVYSIIVVLLYGLMLAYYQNYQTYLGTGRIDIALQGRYIFPVLSLLYVIFLYPIDKYLKNKKIQLLITALICVVFVYGDFFYFLENASDVWYQ